ncbi:MAG TPA: malate dehydrogenase [Spirochaetia bacterium]|nr:malate dehydrogenase [Spirochaetia bacterium]
MPSVSVVGSGNVGANTAFFIAESSPVDVLLCDVKEGMSTGKSLDMMEAAPLRRYRGKLTGADSIDAIRDSAVVIVAAGSIRAPGKKREELYAENSPLISQLAPQIARLAPKSVVIVATEPVDLMTMLFVRESKLPRTRVLGLGGMLDAQRFRTTIARALSLSSENITATVVGPHTDAMMFLPQFTRVGGVPLAQLMSEAEIEKAISAAKGRGDEILRLAARSTSYYAPGACAAELVDAITADLRRVVSLSVVLDGEYGIKGVSLSLPVVLGRQGALKVLQPKLTPDQAKSLAASAEALRAIAKSGGKN